MCIYYVIWFCYIFFKRPRLGCSFCWLDAVKKDRGNHTKTFLEKIGNKETQIKQRSDLSFALKSAFKHWAQRNISAALMVKLHLLTVYYLLTVLKTWWGPKFIFSGWFYQKLFSKLMIFLLLIPQSWNYSTFSRLASSSTSYSKKAIFVWQLSHG